jgi:hypothetical protein
MTTSMSVLDPAAGMADPGPVAGAGSERRDPEVRERARRPTFTAKYKLKILTAYDAAPDGEKGALQRREGLYSSHIVGGWCRRWGVAGRRPDRRRHRAGATVVSGAVRTLDKQVRERLPAGLVCTGGEPLDRTGSYFHRPCLLMCLTAHRGIGKSSLARLR